MDTNKPSQQVRWKRILLIVALATPIITFPIWHRLLLPSFWSADTRCVFEDSQGTVQKGQGINCEGIEQ
ncbi:hypothetical protein H6F98_01105 [Microcoleus sp. FACHB-SPT15]|uniref:hypothetical protein n=1 Tax=Microcoleus sp. FACHB-SPT15 TaxID=2692830 RepID=UPI00177DA23C|nr:hypothetical protein [Microcoleus sp. FACHB-SPT15]MBD1804073.1 hypothetical protein [Microcoleus sp. FACHB-SPT15]